MSKRYNKHLGFTLLELMAVIAIVGVLAAIAIPSYRNYMYKSKVNEIISYAKNLQSSYQNYYILNADHPSALSDLNLNTYTSDLITGTSYNAGDNSLQIDADPSELSSEYSACTMRYFFTPTVANDAITWACTLFNNVDDSCDTFMLNVSPRECTLVP